MLHSRASSLHSTFDPSTSRAPAVATPFPTNSHLFNPWRAFRNVKRYWVTTCVIGLVVIISWSSISSLRSYSTSSVSPSPALVDSYERIVDDGAAPLVDHFRSFKQSDGCRLSSLELFAPSKPVCKDKQSLVKAMSSGGRIGFDAPYSPRDCDMTWFSTSEICSILSRFSHVYLVGDSLIRNIMIAMHVLFRQDLVRGGMRSWEPEHQETVGVDCSCNMVVESKDCSWFHGVFDTENVYQNDPTSMACSRREMAIFTYHALAAHPLKDEDLSPLAESMPTTKPDKPIAIILSHGLWNNFEPDQTNAWVDQVVTAITARAPWLHPNNLAAPYLFITPNAGGEKKLAAHHILQNNFRLAKFEKKVGESLVGSGIDHLGMFNMSVQAYSWDGTHATLRTDLLKCMMILNWLNAYEIGK